MSFAPSKIIRTESVILEVEARPCLWDMTCKSYKNRVVKQNAWLEIAQTIVSDFDCLNEDEKMKAAEKIQSRWKHARDCYNRVAKNMTVLNEKEIKPYVYFNQLTFLNKNNDRYRMNAPRIATIPIDLPNQSSGVALEPSIIDDSDIEKDEEEPKVKKIKYTTDDELRHQLLSMIKNSSKATNDEDTAFFCSLLPAVRELSSLEKLVFRSKVIEELISITRKK